MQKKKIIIIIIASALSLLTATGIILGVTLTSKPSTPTPPTPQPTTYTITVGNVTNGTLSVLVNNAQTTTAKEGDAVKVLPVPNQNYKVQSVYYTKASSTEQISVPNTDGNYTFTMPQSNITVYAQFEQQPKPQPTYAVNKVTPSNGDFVLKAGDKVVNNSLSVDSGTLITIVPTANKGYAPVYIYYTTDSGTNKVNLLPNGEYYSFTMPNKTVSVAVDFVKETDSSEFEFTYQQDSDAYAISKFVGDSTTVVIPKTYNDNTNGEKPVTLIDMNALALTDIQTILISNTITRIAYGAIQQCYSLSNIIFEYQSQLQVIEVDAFSMFAATEIHIPASVEEIQGQAFTDCGKLSKVTFESNSKLHTIGIHAFGSSIIENIVIPASVKSLSGFWRCSSLTTVIIEQGSQLQTIDQYAFQQCGNLQSLVIPQSVTTIDQNAFLAGTKSLTVYYGGTESDWNIKLKNQIKIEHVLYYFSQSKPTGSGNYWYYDASGMPAVWN